MADYSLFDRLKKLFSTDVIIRNVGGKQLKVLDTNRLQSSGNLASNTLVDRYTKLYNSRIPISGATSGEAIMIYRKEMFTDYEAMDTDSIIASYLDILADEVTVKDEFGDTLTIRSDNPKVQTVLRNLFYDILNLEFNLWPWVRNLCKYGDAFFKLKLVEKYGVIGIEPLSSYQLIREEGLNPLKPDTITFKVDPSSMGSRHFLSHTSQREELENYEVAHFRLLNDTNFLPYGKSMLEPARKVWKQLVLMEDAMLIHRIMRSASKRVFKIDVGNIPPNEVDAYMQKIIQQTKKIPYQDPTTGDYNLKFNMQNMVEDFYIPVRGGNDGNAIETSEGLNYDGIQDVEYLKGRMLAALRVPKAFLNFEEGVSGKATLAAEDLRFSRTIERIQRIVISELYKIAVIHLYIQGFTDSEVIDFELSMTAPSSIYEREKIEIWQTKVTLAKDIMDAGIASLSWIYKNIMNMTPEDMERERNMVLEDAKFKFRITQLTEEGNDPIKTGKSFGTAHDIATLYKSDEEGKLPPGYDEKNPKDVVSSTDKLGRPKSNDSYKTHDHPMGQDPLGDKENKKKTTHAPTSHILDGLKKVPRLTTRNNKSSKTLLESLNSVPKKDTQISIDFLNEDNIIDDVDQNTN
jgi:hypothetical protein